MNDTEELLDITSHNFFNKGKWRRLDKEGNPITKNKLIEGMAAMQRAGIKDEKIVDILSSTYNNAYVECQLQVQEQTRQTVDELYSKREKEKILVERGDHAESELASSN